MTQSELSIDLLEKCISEIRIWMAKNFLKLNDDKTEYILFGSQQQLEKIPSRRVSIGNFCTKNTTQVGNLGVILDSNMTMTAHISKITSASSYHLRNIRGIRKYLNRAAAEQLVHAFVSSRLDMSCGDEKNPWWYAQLDSSKPISKVVIYNREDCCGERLIGAEIRVGDDNKSPFNENAQCGATLTSAMIGSNPIEVICNKPIKGKYISVRLPGKKCLTLCEVEIYESVLVTHFVGAKQSSTRGAGGDANRAIDGNTNSIFNQNSCSHTAGESDKNPWWYADLGTPKPISKIVLYNRQDCCADRLIDAQVRVGNTSKSPFTDNVPCGSTVTSTMIESNPIEIVCNKPITGKYITVYLPGTKILTICEVEVYAGIW
ncbi:uncharacterized protein [Antedon mediterranea]|uniref:uncharacterized protein n=1 Tax=Antedon mediterranea TaxID=105859 RepID=UPI003AF78D80